MRNTKVSLDLNIGNHNRSVGTMLSNHLVKKVPNFLFWKNPPVLGYNLKFEQEVLEGKMKQWQDKIKYKNNRPEIIYSWNIDLMNLAG